VLQVRGCSPAHIDRLAVVPSEFRALPGVQPMAGRFEVRDDFITFVPRFPLIAGTAYSLLLDGAEVAGIVVPRAAFVQVASVRRIAPSASEIPFNQLKLYVEFTHAMSEGWAARGIEVRRAADARLLHGVFLPMEPELWDRARRRLTLLFDPGRIKRGLAPQAQAGYPLVEGEPIVVTVSQDFRDAEDRPLVAGAARYYRVGAAARMRVDPARWSIECPEVGTREPLIVAFDRPLDRALLEHSLVVVDAQAGTLAGAVRVAAGERRWGFTPVRAWRAGHYQLVVDARLEDLAGNSLARVFDRDLGRPEDAPVDMEHQIVEFRIR
jgi:hypothetical protein